MRTSIRYDSSGNSGQYLGNTYTQGGDVLHATTRQQCLNREIGLHIPNGNGGFINASMTKTEALHLIAVLSAGVTALDLAQGRAK